MFVKQKMYEYDNVQYGLPQLECENFVPGTFPKRVGTLWPPCAQRASTEQQLLPIRTLKQWIMFLWDKRCKEWQCATCATMTGIWKLHSRDFPKESEDSSTTLCSKVKHRAAVVANGSPEASNLEKMFLWDKRCKEWQCATCATTTGIWKLRSRHFPKESEDSSTTLSSPFKS